ncbi:MAG: hypothetical protein KGH59_01760 [Candidatus Micrarchaeota archaeon]|nr:hypothetical protein [Candidatus Micrarchaeota archaeon]MDE1804489.1 hypothetical protein [Candidatus Micrarchaeota archaeon]MDE1846454.1 hypothetical protein [Candidatus Micrarchaeota archaeon]
MKISKKNHPRFVVPGYGTKNRSRIPDRWRKQRGTDNKKRVALSGYGATPHIGYRNSDSVRFLRADGSREVLVHNHNELMALTSNPKEIVVVLAHDLSRRKRLEMQGVADKFKLRIANRTKAPEPKPQKKAPAKAEQKKPDATDAKKEAAQGAGEKKV